MGSHQSTDAVSPVAVGLAVVDLEGRIQLANGDLAALLGCEPSELAGLSLFDVAHPDDLAALATRVELAANTGQPSSPAVVRSRGPGGGSRWLRVIVHPVIPASAVAQFIVAVEDLTASQWVDRRLNALLARSEERVLLLGADWTILFASPAERRELGARPETLFPIDRFDAVDAQRLRDLFAATLAGADVGPPVTVRVRADDGRRRIREMTMTNRIDDPAVAGIVVNSRDVTAPRAAGSGIETIVERRATGPEKRVLGLPLFSIADPSQPPEWVVVLEAAAGLDAMLFDSGSFHAILRSLDDYRATGLHVPERYALQLMVTGPDIDAAFAQALDRWNEVARPLTPAAWSLVRAEILAREEFDRDAIAGE